MKILKLISLILCFTMLLSALASCAQTDDGNPTEEPTSAPEAPPADEPVVDDQTYYESKFVSFVSYENEAKSAVQITPYYSLSAKFTVTNGYLEQVNAFMGTIGDVKFSLYRWDESHAKTLEGTPIKEKTFLMTDLAKYISTAMYNLELNFEPDEVGEGTYLYVLSAVEDSANYATIYTGKPWLKKQMSDEYKTYGLETFRNGKTDTSLVAQSSFVFSAEVDSPAPEKLPVPTEQDAEGTAKVIILAGQSNAEGVSLTNTLRKQVGDEKYLEYFNGYSNVQIKYANLSGTNDSLQFVNTAVSQGSSTMHFGPELGIAEYLATNYPDERFYIIKYAKGGSILETEWYNAESGIAGYLLTELVDFVNDGLDQIEAQGLTPKIIGMVWNQGESDAIWLPQSSRYYANQAGMVEYVRTAFADYASAKGIAFIDAGIHGGVWNAYRSINLQKYQFSLTSPINFFIDISGLGFTTLKDNDDVAHYDSDCMLKLGHLYGAEIAKMLN